MRESRLADSVVGWAPVPLLALTQTTLVFAWASIALVLLDVSPWLCVNYFLENRAVIALVEFVIILVVLPAESFFWDWSIRKGLEPQIV